MVDQMVPFQTNQTVQLDANGNGTLRFMPNGQNWVVQTVSVQALPSTHDAQVRLYVGPSVGGNTYREGTYAGSSGDISDTVYQVTDGTSLWIVWTGGDPGAIATATITGTCNIPNRGFRAV